MLPRVATRDRPHDTDAHAGPRHRPVSQTIGLTTGRAVAAVLSFGWMVVIARSLDAEAVGGLTLGLTLATALSVLPDMGLPMIVSDRVSRHPDDARSLVTHVIRVRTVVGLATGVLLFAMYRLGTDQTLAVPFFMTMSIVATGVHTTATAGLRGLGQVFPDSLNEITSRLFVIAFGSWLLASGHGIAAAAAVLALADIVSAVVLMRVFWQRTTTGSGFPGVILSRHTVLPLAMALLVGSLLLRIDVWLLALIGDAVDVAHYAVPARLAEGLLLPAGVAAALVVPLTGVSVDDRTRGRQSLRYVGLITGAVAAGAMVIGIWAGSVLELAFGAGYADDETVLRLLCVAAVPSAVSIGLAPIVALLARRSMIRVVLVALAVDIVMNALLLPGHRGIGAAWATIISMTVAAIGMLVTTLRLPDGAKTEAST